MDEVDSLGDDFKQGANLDDPSARFMCSVSDPEKKGEGMSQHITYKITTEQSTAGKVSQSCVFRRFSDFVWLHTQLYNMCKGCLIPPLPDKAIMGRFSLEFINERKRGLNTFLNRIGLHPILSLNSAVDLFLNASEGDLATAVKGEPAAQVQAGLMSFWKSSVQIVSSAIGAVKEREKTPEDMACDQILNYATSLETSFTAVHTNAEALVKKDKDLAKNWFEFGLACTLLGQYETNQQEETLGEVFSKLGNTADLLSVLLTQKTDQENIDFREQLKDYIRLTEAVKNMMKTRQDALNAFQQSTATLESRQAKCNTLSGDKLAAAEKSVMEAQTQLDMDTKALDDITKICLEEANRFKEEKQADLKRIVTEFVKLQIEHSKKVQGVWEGVLPALQQQSGSAGQNALN